MEIFLAQSPQCYFYHLCQRDQVNITDEERALEMFFGTYTLSKSDLDSLFNFLKSRIYRGENPLRVVNVTTVMIDQFVTSNFLPFSGIRNLFDISSMLLPTNEFMTYTEYLQEQEEVCD